MEAIASGPHLLTDKGLKAPECIASGEDAHAAGSDEQTGNDEHDTPDDLFPDDRENARDHQDDSQYPEHCCQHDVLLREVRPRLRSRCTPRISAFIPSARSLVI